MKYIIRAALLLIILFGSFCLPVKVVAERLVEGIVADDDKHAAAQFSNLNLNLNSGGGGFVPDPCQPPTQTALVRVRIPSSFADFADTTKGDKGRRVRFLTNAVTDVTDPTTGENVNVSSTPGDEYDSNPFHIDLVSIPVNAGDWIRVRVILIDPKLKFQESGGVKGIVYYPADKQKTVSFCQPNGTDELNSPVFNGPVRSVLTFFIQRGKTKEMPINLVIVPRASETGAKFGSETPILIDPKIKNDG